MIVHVGAVEKQDVNVAGELTVLKAVVEQMNARSLTRRLADSLTR